ncbi:DUF1656 domain-containing protein [Novosphingobium sp. ZN18A2]|uniref:DUF1656 domain-containing protein n=1 Tax=Novosphingobium sp. ZN18A2 TaxID=3079861 RepID=UPI0030CF07F7
MNGEVAFHGIYVPTLLVFAVLAAVVTMGLVRIFNLLGLYRFVAYRALVDLCLFILVLGLISWASPYFGIHQ